MKVHIRILFGFISALSLCYACLAQGTKAPAKKATPPAAVAPSPSVEDVLWWLPPDTESLFVAKGPFALMPALRMASKESVLLKQLQLLTIAILGKSEEEDSMLPKELVGARIQLAVEGARNFRPPRSLGLMPYEGCQIIFFSPSFGARGEALFRYLTEGAKQRIEMEGQIVYVTEEKLEEDLWNFYFVRPEPNLFLAATDEKYLREVLARRGKKIEPRALPATLPEWKYIDRADSYWALRHFDQSRAEADPSSPFGGQKAANEPDEKAIGLAFSFRVAAGKEMRLYYLSRSTTSIEIAEKQWNQAQEGMYVKGRRVAPGVVEMTIRLDDEEALAYFIFVLTGVFGHGVYL
jgi:hypothetical protein